MTSIKPIDSTTFQDDPVLAVFSKQEKKYCFASLIIIFLSSAIFGLWFKVKQLSIASPEIIRFYPVTGYFIAVLQSIFSFTVLWLGLVLACRFVDRDKNLATNMFVGSLPFTAFMLSVFDVALPVQFRLFLLFVCILFLVKVYQNRAILEEIKEPLTVLILLFIVHMFVYKSLSPWFDTGYFRTWGRLDFWVNLEHQWENAKAYDFVGNFTQHGKLGGNPQAIWMVSELLSLIILLLDIPLVDGLSKYNLIPQMHFYLYVFGAYGCYFFLSHGLKLSLLPSLIGGLGFIFGNAAFLSLFGAEWPIHQMPFLFFPWVCLFLKRAHDSNNLVLVCAAGLVASLAEYALSSHPETNFGYLFFCTTYNVYLAFIRLAKDRCELKSVRRFFKWVFLFPIFHLVGLSYKWIPMFVAIITKEFALLDTQQQLGLWWPGDLTHYSTFFFRFEDMTKLPTKDLGHFGFGAMWLGAVVYFYAGQFAALMIFCFIFYFLAEAWRKAFKKNENTDSNVFWENASYFLLMFSLLAWVMPMGDQSWFSKFAVWSGFPLLRVHHLTRVNIFYYFIALVSAMCGLEYILRQKKLVVFNVLFGTYLLTLAGVYFSPLLYAIPDKPRLDAGILIVTYLSIALFIKSYSLFGNEKPANAFRALMSLAILAVAFFSLITVCTICNKYATQKNYADMESAKDRLFISFRTQVVYLKNNLHDRASFKHLEQRLETFRDYLDSKIRQGSVSTAYYDKINNAFEQFEHSNQQIRNALRDVQQNQENVFWGSFGKADKAREHLFANKLEFFETMAPEIDNFYLSDGRTWMWLDSHPVYGGPLTSEGSSGMQYYLPDKYQLFVYLESNETSMMLPVGKNSELIGPPFFAAGISFPSINVGFHLRRLHHDYSRDFEVVSADYQTRRLQAEQITAAKSVKKLMNILGVDHLLFFDSYLMSRPSPSRILDDLKSMGWISVVLPESSKFDASSGRYGVRHQVHVFKNPQSYGRAYIAKWVKTIKPEENILNLDLFHLPGRFAWSRSRELLRNFEFNLAKIPEDIEKSAIMESTDPGDYSDNPRVYNSSGNNVDIIKIIGSKAVFDVDCADKNCWFVYNTAALKGWEAFSGSNRLPIYKANLGFIGVKLNKGKHFVWMEYWPFLLPLSFIIMLSGWLFVFFLRLFDPGYAETRRLKHDCEMSC